MNGVVSTFLSTGCVRNRKRLLSGTQASFLGPMPSVILKQKFRRSNYPSTSEWVEAVITEIKSVLLPAAPPSLEATEPGEGDLPEPLRKMPGELQAIASNTHAGKDFDADLNLHQRLDAMIHRQVKHLIQLKANKQMLRQTSAA
jgi:hypothetical protein